MKTKFKIAERHTLVKKPVWWINFTRSSFELGKRSEFRDPIWNTLLKEYNAELVFSKYEDNIVWVKFKDKDSLTMFKLRWSE